MSTAAVYLVLSSYTDLTDLISTRIYSILMPQDATRPALTFQRIARDRENTLSDAGGNGVVRDRYRFTAWGATLDECHDIADQVRLALKNATTLESVPVFEADEYESDTKLYSVVSDFSIWYKY